MHRNFPLGLSEGFSKPTESGTDRPKQSEKKTNLNATPKTLVYDPLLTEESGRKETGVVGVKDVGRRRRVEERSEWRIEVTGCCRSSGTLEDRWRQGQRLPANVMTDD